MSFPSSAPAVLNVDLSALAANYRVFQNSVGPGCAVAGVIKADGYGLGVDKVLAALENEDCPFYFVATPEEGLHVRKLTQKPVAVLGGVYPGMEDDFIHAPLIPVLNCLADIGRWGAAAARHGIPLPAIIHADTGMNRLGLGAEEALRLAAEPERLAGIKPLCLMSHFACADEKDHPMTADQAEKFAKIASALPPMKKSLANSSGAFRSTAYHYDMIRPGMALYGLNPTPEAANPMQPVVSLSVRVLQVRDVQAGDSVGYGASHRFSEPGRMASVALGYADGYLRSLSGRGTLYFNGAACPVVGRVSMDAVTVDVTGLKTPPQPGDIMEVLGPHQDADTLAAAAETIGYEILTDLGQRFLRTYTG